MLAKQEIASPLLSPAGAVVLDAPGAPALTCRCPACGDIRVFDALAVTCRCADEDSDDDRRTVGMRVARVS